MTATEHKPILPCPFCGGPARITLFAGVYTIACTECPACILPGPYQTKDPAIAAWNRRVDFRQNEMSAEELISAALRAKEEEAV